MNLRPYTTLSEDELLGCLREGEEKAFTEVYNRYWQKLLAIAFFYTHHKQEAEDIVHEVMMSLWIRKSDLRINSLEPFLATAVKFSVFKYISRSKRRKELLAQSGRETLSSYLEEKLDARFLEEYLQGRVERLPPKAKLVFTYSRTEALNIKEIAEKMELSPKAVEYHLTKALKALRDALGKIKSVFV